ncbi:hypothetical protein [Serpentinicella alkaliphila]|uniref:Uncharacterized protein n=1 Tax=Serpentinicella alkaliphila TaxID=1734049 RepID=A0A4R2SWA7_9FIRM|nr:hypothetical protein [Serpentinicella alkaliphila]QUH25562.1 hypothetical protein HZR23_07300 [Serpentinicella alkaliphila]TCP94757.1 hypothetical protein EDD79_107210 [Serpentinicella alkaliphila]
MPTRMYEVKKGCLKFRETKHCKTIIHEMAWKIIMRMRGFVIKKMCD